MNIEAVKVADAALRQPMGNGLDVDRGSRRKSDDLSSNEKVEKKQIQPEEMLQQIKALTEDGLFSIRFENDGDSGKMVVKVVDPETDEVIRQIPADELMHLTEQLQDLRGNIVNTEG